MRSRTVRQYNYHNAAHLLGYLSEASLTDLERDSTIMRGDFVGRSGVERTYEEVLRGIKGEEIFLPRCPVAVSKDVWMAVRTTVLPSQGVTSRSPSMLACKSWASA